MNHAVAQRLTRFAEDTARVERKVDEILAILRGDVTPADLPGALAGVRSALYAYGHVHHSGEDPEHAIRRALVVERSRRDEAINERREIQSERDDLAAKLDRALDSLAAMESVAEKLCSEWPGGPARILPGGVVVLPGSLSTLLRERRRWWGRLRR